MDYQKIFITNLPSFYKINLYNRIEAYYRKRGKHILVIYTGQQGNDRNKDFFKGNMQFEHILLKGNNISRCRQLLHILKHKSYENLIIGGWDSPEAWLAAILSPKTKNSVVAESSVWESKTDGLKGSIKRMFITNIRDKAYVPGKSNATLLKRLGFKGKIVYTKGVGVFNYIPQPPYKTKSEVKRFLYVGRLVDVKNLKMLINVFNKLPQLTLTIVGFGEQEAELKSIAKNNIIFTGAINNKALPQVYQQNDVFILPSKSEPWGLVVEEALNNGIPVIVSNKVGCHEAIVNKNNGIVFAPFNSTSALKEAVLRMTDISFYNNLRYNISQLDFNKIEEEQVNCYINA